MTEDDASECESDSSITNKQRKLIRVFPTADTIRLLKYTIFGIAGSNSTNNEILGDDLPSRMRTRNKPAKDQPSNKRPKRGGADNNASDAPTETTKTPNKTEKRKSTRDTPTKGKKRANIDMDTDNDGSEEKEKRKRTDVSVIFRAISPCAPFKPMFFVYEFFCRVQPKV